METNQGQQSVDRWHLHPDDIAARYATDFCQRNSSYQIGSQTYFDLMHEVQQRIDAGIASGKLKLRSWPGRFVLAPSSTITNNTLVDLQDFCDAADVLGIDCPKNACDLAQTFRLQNIPPAPAPALAPPNLSTDALPNSSSTDSASTLQLTETPHARQDRLLALFEAEEKVKIRGATQRLAEREGIDRSNMKKGINAARKRRDEKAREGTWASSFVRGGKRQP